MAAPASSAVFEPGGHLEAQARWSGWEIAFWLATLLPFLLFPNHLVLASQIAITALFALSLDLILGYAGIVSLGHAAFFGLGAYTAGIMSKHGWTDPFLGLLAGAAVAGIAGYATSFIIARFRHLPLIMITMGLGFLLHEAANSAEWLTGGSDGLQGVRKGKLLGVIAFDLYGYAAYAYALCVLFLVFLACGASSTRRSALLCEASARTPCACPPSARRAARTSARSTPSPPWSPASLARC